MSTKIFNGYRLRTQSIRALNRALDDFRARLEPVAQAEYNEAFGRLAALYADARLAGIESKADTRFGEEDTAKCPASSAWSVFDARQSKVRTTHRRDPGYDFDCDLSIYPDNPWTFVVFIAEPSRYVEVWHETPGVEAYPYWNSSDPPKGWTWENWSKVRGGQWRRRLERKPLVWSLYHEYGGPHPPSGDDLVTTQPPRSERLKTLAINVARKQMPPELLQLLKKEQYGWLQAYQEWIESDEYKTRLTEATVKLDDILPEHLSLDDLLGKSEIPAHDTVASTADA